ncbi:MAG: hypothetical protein AVDCRST_MAG65-358 [uncultured Solirubrobacteraceae bacterium]|uniref:Uncharacterized protein n=1 Tax=uncultured Solirubrobacteraceae bacterium TaxID=1162706 RepID=A0A6J4RG65_9ACTN|nr:MAG: hypothetical protein AVDCRST_MAG65-358 [uncultured Solirubrobacteraceae bacterium]
MRTSVPSFAGLVATSAVVAALVVAGPAGAQTGTERTVTAIGIGSIKPEPSDRRSNASIRRAVAQARTETVGLAIDAAERRARLIAAEAGFVLGGALAMKEVVSSLPWEADYAALGAFGPGQYCRKFRRPIIRRRDGRRRVVGHRTRRVCVVPQAVTTRVEVTYAAGTPVG